jgi:hypothetical protein
VLGSHLGPACEIRAGQALRRMLLTAQAIGLRGVLLAGSLEHAGTRERDIPGARGGLMPQAVPEVRPV